MHDKICVTMMIKPHLILQWFIPPSVNVTSNAFVK